MNKNNRNLILWVIIGLFVLALYNMFQTGADRLEGQDLTYSDFIKAVESNRVADAVIKGDHVVGKFTSGQNFNVDVPNDPALVERLLKNNVNVKAASSEEGFSFFSMY